MVTSLLCLCRSLPISVRICIIYVNKCVVFRDILKHCFTPIQVSGGGVGQHPEPAVYTPCRHHGILTAVISPTFYCPAGHKGTVVHQVDGKLNKFVIIVESRYLELGYLEFCKYRSVYLNKKYILIAFSNLNLLLETFLHVQITRSAN